MGAALIPLQTRLLNLESTAINCFRFQWKRIWSQIYIVIICVITKSFSDDNNDKIKKSWKFNRYGLTERDSAEAERRRR